MTDVSQSTRAPAYRSEAYRRALLTAMGPVSFNDFHEQLTPLWEVHGWRVGLDAVAETLAGFRNTAAFMGSPRDAFGRLPITQLLTGMEEDQFLVTAVEVAQNMGPETPYHEAFGKALKMGQETGRDLQMLAPFFQSALNAIDAADGDRNAGRPYLFKAAKSYHEGVEPGATVMALIAHAAIRPIAFPPGDTWVEPYLQRERMVLSDGSQAMWEDAGWEEMKNFVEARAPYLVAPEEPGGDSARPRRKKGGRKGVTRRLDPECTCGHHHR